jgi:DNA-binding transcriptional regulator YiaG
MKLKKYLKLKSMTYEQFAKEINCHKTAVFFWVTGRRIPNGANMDLIRKITDGAVEPNDFFSE